MFCYNEFITLIKTHVSSRKPNMHYDVFLETLSRSDKWTCIVKFERVKISHIPMLQKFSLDHNALGQDISVK